MLTIKQISHYKRFKNTTRSMRSTSIAVWRTRIPFPKRSVLDSNIRTTDTFQCVLLDEHKNGGTPFQLPGYYHNEAMVKPVLNQKYYFKSEEMILRHMQNKNYFDNSTFFRDTNLKVVYVTFEDDIDFTTQFKDLFSLPSHFGTAPIISNTIEDVEVELPNTEVTNPLPNTFPNTGFIGGCCEGINTWVVSDHVTSVLSNMWSSTWTYATIATISAICVWLNLTPEIAAQIAIESIEPPGSPRGG